jgi:3-methyladenine DNA glycosylase AlkC
VANRIGAKNVKSVDKAILKKLNTGEIETANLVEGLAIDFEILAAHTKITTEKFEEKSIVKRMQYYGSKMEDWQKFKNHSSDTVRGWAAYSLVNSSLSFSDKLKNILHFADDSHFGVREWAWLAMRPQLIENLETSIKFMAKNTRSKSERIRRFCCESIRPRGVWCSHIDELKENPSLASDVLENLKTDTSKYVKDSVGNWLNDASKSQSQWVKKLCADWKKLKNKDTDYIIKKALRSL